MDSQFIETPTTLFYTEHQTASKTNPMIKKDIVKFDTEKLTFLLRKNGHLGEANVTGIDLTPMETNGIASDYFRIDSPVRTPLFCIRIAIFGIFFTRRMGSKMSASFLTGRCGEPVWQDGIWPI